jgi:hypothetical protein
MTYTSQMYVQLLWKILLHNIMKLAPLLQYLNQVDVVQTLLMKISQMDLQMWLLTMLPP